MTREEAIWWVNHLFEIRKEEYFNKGMMKDAKEVEEAQTMVLEALQAEYEDYEHATLVDIKEPLKVAVVRCKDCRWQEECSQFVVLRKFSGVYQEIDFCSCGERREE